MKPNTRAVLLAVATLLLFGVLELASELWLELESTPRWILRISLIVLGVVAALLVYFLLRRPPAKDPTGDVAAERVDQGFKGAAKRLRTSALASRARLDRLPAVLIMGPKGAAKTTVLLRSGINPELLSGEPERGDAVVATEGLNLWYGKGAVFVEAGGGLLESPRGWERLARHLRPARLAAAVLGKGQAPRAAVVCVGADEFQRPDSRERLKTLAGLLRTRLNEVSRRLGVRLPVYVLFTRSDRIPHFEAYAAAYTATEADEGLGATLPLDPSPDLGAYAGREGARIQAAFQQVVRELTDGRPAQLARIRDRDVRGAAYEFPREVGKMAEPATEFMLELCRPSQLDVSPFLRGFYFTGVRPIVLEDGGAAQVPVSRGDAPVAGATAVFNVAAMGGAQPAPPVGHQRRVPQWVHLAPFVPRVILSDEKARKVTSGGAGVRGVRRLVLYAAMIALAVVGVGVVRSYLGNRDLQRQAGRAIAAAAQLPPGEASLPEVGEFRRLDSLRAVAALLRSYEVDGRPGRLGWGLYQGRPLLPPVRSAYFRGFRRLLWTGAYQELDRELAALPEVPGDTSSYAETYATLKAYLIVTEHPDRSTPDFLAPVLRSHWLGGRALDDERLALVDDQMAFYASELPFGDPYDESMDAAMVDRTRRFLSQFAGEEQLFQSLVSAASDSIPAVDFRRDVPGSEGIVATSVVVPGAYTADGWDLVSQRLQDIDQILASEEWVLGEQTITSLDRTRLAEQLAARYAQEYRDVWLRYLSEAGVARYASPADASRKLSALSGNLSPLLQLLALASRNTNVDTVQIGPTFQPVHSLLPPDQEGRFVSESNEGYLRGLRQLQTAMSEVADAQGEDRRAAAEAARGPAGDARAAARDATGAFSVEDDAVRVAMAVEGLLLQPIDNADRLIQGLPTAEAASEGTAYCTQFNQVTGKYPFAPGATQEATLEEVVGILAPGSGSLWGYIDSQLQNRVERQGGAYVARQGANPPVSQEFLTFLNRSATISRTLFPNSSPTPQVAFTLQALNTPDVPQITVVLEGQSHTWTPTQRPSQTYVWEGQGQRAAQVLATVEGAAVTAVEQPAGPWAVFRLLQLGTWQTRQPGTYEIRWPIGGQELDVAVELRMVGGQPIFRSDFLAGLRCVGSVAR